MTTPVGRDVDIGEANLKLYGKLSASFRDIAHALYCADHILKKNLNGWPWSRRGNIYKEQTAYTTSLVVSYCRPFTHSKGWPEFPSELVQHTSEENELHQRLRSYRNQIFAHTDSIHFEYRPVSWPAVDTVLTREPAYRLSKEETVLVRGMTSALLPRIRSRLTDLFEHKTHDL